MCTCGRQDGGPSGSAALESAAIFVAAPGGEQRLALEAAACGAAIALGPDEAERLARDAERREREGAASRHRAETQSFDALADELDTVYSRLVRKRRARPERDDDPLADRDWITIDLHMHTDWSHDCSTRSRTSSSTPRRSVSAESP